MGLFTWEEREEAQYLAEKHGKAFIEVTYSRLTPFFEYKVYADDGRLERYEHALKAIADFDGGTPPEGIARIVQSALDPKVRCYRCHGLRWIGEFVSAYGDDPGINTLQRCPECLGDDPATPGSSTT